MGSNIKLIAAAPKLLTSLQDAIIRLEWKKKNQPTLFNKSDDEKLQEWQNLVESIL